ncbi:MAG: NAD(P)/FAD-dependent oxidoreductase [Chloroflexi bacterium]|nr:NAD(P)/FAD-dependent oxidoreductase [Chloroflexota bacterium]
MYDVMIVGAGPVGSYLAYRMAELGYKVIVFERRAKVGEAVCCTGIIGKECFDRFPVVNYGVLTQASSAKFFSPSARCLRLSKETAQAYVVDRVVFDSALAEKAQGKGAEYLLSARVENISLRNDGVTARVERRGKVVDFDAKIALISSGFGGALTRRLGLGEIGDFVLGAQAEVVVEKLEEVEVYFGREIAPGFFGWLVPTYPGKALAGLLSRRSPGSHLKSLMESLKAQHKIISTESKITYGGIPLTPLPKTYMERLLVVGDAAGQVKPTTGGGVYYGLLCADIAVDVTHNALCADDFTSRGLSSYEKMWKKKLGRELEIGYWARKLCEKLSDRQGEQIFGIIEANGLHESLLQSPDFSFDWHGNLIMRALKDKRLHQAVRNMTKSSFLLKLSQGR